MKKNRIVKKQETRLNRECRKQDKLLVWKKSVFSSHPYYRTRTGYGMAGIPRRIQRGRACRMMQLVWTREAANAALYANPWGWRV